MHHRDLSPKEITVYRKVYEFGTTECWGIMLIIALIDLKSCTYLQPLPFGFLNQQNGSYYKGWKAGGEGDNRRRYGWMASLTQWTRVWANSGRQWKTAKSGLLQFMGSQRVRINWATEQQQQCIVTRIQIKHVDKTLRGMGEHRKKQPLWAGGSRKISQRTGELVGTPRGEEGLSGCHELCRAENQATCQSVSIQGSFWRRNTF